MGEGSGVDEIGVLGVMKSPFVRAAVTLAGGSLRVSVIVAADTELGHSSAKKSLLAHSQRGT